MLVSSPGTPEWTNLELSAGQVERMSSGYSYEQDRHIQALVWLLDRLQGARHSALLALDRAMLFRVTAALHSTL